MKPIREVNYTAVIITAVLCFTVIASIALWKGYDTGLALAICSLIAGLIGWEAKAYRVKRETGT